MLNKIEKGLFRLVVTSFIVTLIILISYITIKNNSSWFIPNGTYNFVDFITCSYNYKYICDTMITVIKSCSIICAILSIVELPLAFLCEK